MKENALKFVNLLTPGNFDEAQIWLSTSCEYSYNDGVLLGEEIIGAFRASHNNAKNRLDDIVYLDGTVEKIEGQNVHVIVKDKISANGKNYVYTDRLIITCNDKNGHGSIDRIEHSPINGEKEKLHAFFESIGLVWN